MQALVSDGEGLEIAERPTPSPGAGELLVSVRAAGLNAADLLQVAGKYPAPAGVPSDILGLEFAGEVAAVGEGVQRFAIGDSVMGVVGGGAQAEFVVIHERAAMPVPQVLGWEEAGGFAEVFTTAHDALFTQCNLALGERVAVQGGAGGVGLAALQLAVAAGARVTATVRSTQHHQAVAALGARVLNPQDFANSGPYDVILELVGGSNVARDLDEIAIQGRIVVIGISAGARAEINLRRLMSQRGSICGSTLRARPLEGKAIAARRVEQHVLPLVESGSIKVPIHSVFPLDQAQEAYAAFAAGGKFGKIVLSF